MALTIVAALVAAACFAAASALQHRSATATPVFGGYGVRSLARFVAQTLRHPAWLAGSVADLVGLGLHALALHGGPLTVVQPVMVAGLVFALPLRQWLDHRRPGRRELLCAGALSVGLIVFLVASTPTADPTSSADRGPALVALVGIAVVVVVCAVLGRLFHGAAAAATLGLGAGVAFAGTATALKATTSAGAHGPVALCTSWPLYGLIAAGAAGLLLSQLAFQAGPLRASLPAMSTIDPLVSLVIGIGVYDERLRTSPLEFVATVVGVAVTLGAAVALSRWQGHEAASLAGV